MSTQNGEQGTGTGLLRDMALGMVGACLGGAVGHWLFSLMLRGGLYAGALPGAVLGLGCGCLSGRKSVPLGIVCGVLGLALGIVTEWRFMPFVKDQGFVFFITHLHVLPAIKLILLALGGVLASWFGRGREGGVWPRRREALRKEPGGPAGPS